MELTDGMKERIALAIKAKGMTQTQFAEELGKGRAWASIFLAERKKKGSIKTITAEMEERVNEILGIKLRVFSPSDPVSGTALELSRIAEKNPHVNAILEELLALYGSLTDQAA